MLAELLEHDHGQQMRAGPAARGHMEGRRRLVHGLPGPAGDLLAHGLDDLPLAGNDLQSFGDVFTDFREVRPAAAGARCRAGDNNPLARQMVRQGFPIGGLPRRRGLRLSSISSGGSCFRGLLSLSLVSLQIFERKLKLLGLCRQTF